METNVKSSCNSCDRTTEKGGVGSRLPSASLCFFLDGNQWCCVYGDFINYQESPAGFGHTFEEALSDLYINTTKYTNKGEQL